MLEKSVEITSESDDKVMLIETFGKDNVSEDNTYVLNLSLSKLQHELNNSMPDGPYSVIVSDKNWRQKLLMFKLL